MKLFKYASLMSLGVLLIGGIAAKRADAQIVLNGQPGNTALVDSASDRSSDLGSALTPQAYVQQVLGVQTGQANRVQAAPTTAAVATPAPGVAGESEYDRLMRLGYAESKVGNHQMALQYFEGALAVNPGDRMATIAYWNTVNALQVLNAQQQAPSSTRAARIGAVSSGSAAASTVSTFDQYMNAGYAAAEIHDYEAALRYFTNAQQLQPNNPYAIQAIRNVTTYMQVAGSQSDAAQ